MALKSKLVASALGVVLLFGGTVPGAAAQQVAQAAEQEDAGFDDWGLLGLLGLLGLAGLKKRNDDRSTRTTNG